MHLTALLCAMSLLSGCYDPKSVEKFLQQPFRPVSAVEYRIYPPDTLLVSSPNIREFKPEVGKRGIIIYVKPDGKINLPLMGEVYAAGKTVKEIEKSILKAAAAYYSEATVNVDVLGFNSQKYYVFGQVATPGSRPWTGHDTLLAALADAQPTEFAWPERIMIVRGDTPQEGGRKRDKSMRYVATGVTPERRGHPQKRMIINMMAMVRSGDLSNNLLLMPNDIIYVQPNPFARVGLAMQQVLFPVRQTRDVITNSRAIVDKNFDEGVWNNDNGSN